MTLLYPDRFFAQRLTAEIQQVSDNRAVNLAAGMAANYPEYRENVGYLAALRDVNKLMDKIHKEISGA